MFEDAATTKKETEYQDRLAKNPERVIGVLQNGIKMAEKIIKEANQKVQSHLLKKILKLDELTQSNMKVATGVKRTVFRDLKTQKKKKSEIC